MMFRDGTVSASFNVRKKDASTFWISCEKPLHKIILSPSYCPGTSLFDLPLPRQEKRSRRRHFEIVLEDYDLKAHLLNISFSFPPTQSISTKHKSWPPNLWVRQMNNSGQSQKLPFNLSNISLPNRDETLSRLLSTNYLFHPSVHSYISNNPSPDLSSATVRRNTDLENRVAELEVELSVWKQAHSVALEASEREVKAHNVQIAALNRQISNLDCFKTVRFFILSSGSRAILQQHHCKPT